MGITQIYQPRRNQAMSVACFMSGSGTNAKKIIDRSLEPDSGFKVVLVFTDVRDDKVDRDGNRVCRATEIAKEYGISYECVDILDFYQNRGHKTKRDLSLRPHYDRSVLRLINQYNLDLIALAGYMSIVTKPLLNKYSGRIVNVHPADLSVMDNGGRKFVGMRAVKDAMLAGEEMIYSTTHIVREKVDYGEILIRSKPLKVKLPKNLTLEDLRKDKSLLHRVEKEHQNMLKERGDWVIYPLTIQMISEGRFALDASRNIYVDGKLATNGLRL